MRSMNDHLANAMHGHKQRSGKQRAESLRKAGHACDRIKDATSRGFQVDLSTTHQRNILYCAVKKSERNTCSGGRMPLSSP